MRQQCHLLLRKAIENYFRLSVEALCPCRVRYVTRYRSCSLICKCTLQTGRAYQTNQNDIWFLCLVRVYRSGCLGFAISFEGLSVYVCLDCLYFRQRSDHSNSRTKVARAAILL